MKDKAFEAETELRVSLSALGLGRFVLADGSDIAFPHSLAFDFDYRAAYESGAIERILLSPDCDKAHLDAQLARFGMAPGTNSNPSRIRGIDLATTRCSEQCD